MTCDSSGTIQRACSIRRSTAFSFVAARRLFESAVDYLDSEHSDFEDRFIAIGPIERGLLVVVYTEREEEIIRIIGARWANPREHSLYRSYMDQNR